MMEMIALTLGFRQTTIKTMRRADVILRANGRGTCNECRAAHLRGLEEDDLNGKMEEEEEGWEGRNEARLILQFASCPDHPQCSLTF
jgi:hypothetical protein